jgi:hypothetical protein
MGLKEGAIRKNGLPARKPGMAADPNKKSRPKGTFLKGVERPHVWITGTDKYKHDMYHPWQVAKAQANYRLREGLEEGGWELEFEDWYELWKDHWNDRGRLSHNKCMTRIDFEKPWSRTNCEIVDRQEHSKRIGKYQRELRQQMQERLGIPQYRKLKIYREGKK